MLVPPNVPFLDNALWGAYASTEELHQRGAAFLVLDVHIESRVDDIVQHAQ